MSVDSAVSFCCRFLTPACKVSLISVRDGLLARSFCRAMIALLRSTLVGRLSRSLADATGAVPAMLRQCKAKSTNLPRRGTARLELQVVYAAPVAHLTVAIPSCLPSSSPCARLKAVWGRPQVLELW